MVSHARRSRFGDRHDYYNVELYPYHYIAAGVLAVGGLLALLRVLRSEEDA